MKKLSELELALKKIATVVQDRLSTKQNVLTAGTGITIALDGTISATGGEGGVQSDWNQTDSTANDFIKNKPTIPVVPTNVSDFNNDAGYLTQHQDISGKADKSEMSVTDGTGADSDKTTIQLKSGTSATVLKSHQSLIGKQDVIDAQHKLSADLVDDSTTTNKFTNATEKQTWNNKQDALVSGTNIKTINNESILGDGNITIQGGGSSLFYGTSSTAAATVQKEVSIPSITSLETGQVIHVKPSTTSTVANSTIKLNSFTAYPMRYNDAAITTSTDSIVWNANYISSFLFDGTYWQFIGHGLDSNTTYSALALADGKTGTATAARTISASVLKGVIDYHSKPLVVTKSSGTSLTAAINNYYRFTYNVGTLAITLPTPTSDNIESILFFMTTGSSPKVTFTSTGNTIYKNDGFAIDATTTYEINALWNGGAWVINAVKYTV